MKVYIRKHDYDAGKYIYRGYYEAWKYLGYDARYYEHLSDLKEEKNFILMTMDHNLDENYLNVVDNASAAFITVQPNNFDAPWGLCPTFISSANKNIINKINKKNNVIKWCFGEIIKEKNYFNLWGDVETIPLAFDNISYSDFKNDEKYKFDVCFVGGIANNGLNEKYKIMLETFSEFKKTNLKCGIFVNRGLTHEQEKNIIFNSKICLNVHDAYQKKLGYDTNERTFKTMGINGILVSDNIKQISDLLDDVFLVNTPKEYVEKCYEILKKDVSILEIIKQNNKKNILKNHTYLCRIKNMLELASNLKLDTTIKVSKN